MKELSIEEKAKHYDEAIERAKKWYNAPNIDKMPTYGNRVIEEIFPELKESEGEKWIPKEITKYLKEKGGFRSCWIAWLEKQGGQMITGWDSKDEKIRYAIIDTLDRTDQSIMEHNYGISHQQVKEWLGNIRNRVVPQPKKKWSEKDQSMMHEAIHRIGQLDHYWNRPSDVKLIEWLKSLKDREI